MKKLVVVLALAGVAWFAYSGYAKSRAVRWTYEGKTIRAEKPNNTYIFADNGDTRAELRVFGFNDEPLGHAEMGPHAIITHLFIVSPMADNEEIFRQQFCEKSSFDQASMVNIIAADPKVHKKVELFRKSKDERKCVRLTGKSLLQKQEFYKGEELKDAYVTSTMPYDAQKFILLSDIEPVACR